VAVLNKYPHVSSEYNIILERTGGKDFMEIRVERSPESDPARDAEGGGPDRQAHQGRGDGDPDRDHRGLRLAPALRAQSKRVYDTGSTDRKDETTNG